MLYFIELSQFSAQDFAITRALRTQMDRSAGSAARWAEWRPDQAGINSWADVALINTAHLNWIQLKSVVNRCTAETIVLTGCRDSLLGLPVLPHVDALDELLQFMPGRDSGITLSMEHRGLGGFVRHCGEATNTTPMPLKANLSGHGIAR